MAKTVQEQKPNKVIEILKKEYPFERILLGVLGVFVILLGVYLVDGKELISIKLTSWWIFNTDLKRTLFATFIILVGSFAFFMAVWAFFVPSFAEMKKVTWPSRSTIANHSARVFGFIIVLSLFFVVIDLGLVRLFKWIIG